MRRRNEAMSFALVHRPALSPHTTGREHGATEWGEKRQKAPRIFYHRRRRQIGVSGLRPDQSVLVARRRAVLQNTSGPVFEQAFQTGVLWSLTQWRFNKTYPVPQFGQVSMSVVRKIRMTRCGNLRQARSAGDSGKVAHVDPESLSCIVSVLMSAGSGRSAGPVTVL